MSERKHPIDGEYGFEVVEDSYETEQRWTVQLPHQCDEWVIAYGDDPVDALSKLGAFIAEAQAARAKLVALVGADFR